jgi:hypothetical protein
MKRFRQPFRSKHSTLGSPQNPDAEKHAISNEEYQRLRADERDRAQEREREKQRDRQRAQERDRAEADQIIIQTLQDAARDRGLKIPADLVAVPATSPESQPPSAEIKFVARTGRKPRRKLRAQTVAAPGSGTALERHARKCSICHHADRELIEEDFLHWHPAATIVYDYDIGDTRVVYRHAHATGIYARRMKNVRMAAAHIIEKVEGLTPTAGHVLHAIRALSRIDDEGRWIEPPVEIVVSSGTRRPPAEPKRAEAVELERTPLRPTAESAPSESAGDEPVVSQLIISNRSACRLESPVTDSKQTTG